MQVCFANIKLRSAAATLWWNPTLCFLDWLGETLVNRTPGPMGLTLIDIVWNMKVPIKMLKYLFKKPFYSIWGFLYPHTKKIIKTLKSTDIFIIHIPRYTVTGIWTHNLPTCIFWPWHYRPYRDLHLSDWSLCPIAASTLGALGLSRKQLTWSPSNIT